MQLGPFLQQCRQQSGFSLEELAKQLRISTEQLESLEHDRFDLFDGEDQIKDVLSELAELIDLSPSAVLRLYQRQVQTSLEGTIYSGTDAPATLEPVPQETTLSQSTEPQRRTRRRRRRPFPWQALLIFCAAIGLTVWLWKNIDPPGGAQSGGVLAYEPAEFLVIPPQGGMIRVVTTEVHQLRLVVDDKPEKTYRMEAGSGIRLQVRDEALLTWDRPGGVALFFNEIPLPISQQNQAHLLPAPELEEDPEEP